eukprot:jgi/Ulvmu1/12866/UM098_0051.1
MRNARGLRSLSVSNIRRDMDVSLIAFARLPVPGKVKTRLAEGCGAQAACDFYSACLTHCLQVALETGHKVYCCCSDEAEVPPMQEWLYSKGLIVHVSSQVQDEDLGARMLAAATTALQGGASTVVIFGTDVPGLQKDIFDAAVSQLDTHDAVLGPSHDGGYYMIGMKQPQPAIFQDVQWSTSAVLSTTLAAAQEHGITVPDPMRLPKLLDIDFITDLQSWMQESTEEEEGTLLYKAAHEALKKANLET